MRLLSKSLNLNIRISFTSQIKRLALRITSQGNTNPEIWKASHYHIMVSLIGNCFDSARGLITKTPNAHATSKSIFDSHHGLYFFGRCHPKFLYILLCKARGILYIRDLVQDLRYVLTIIYSHTTFLSTFDLRI